MVSAEFRKRIQGSGIDQAFERFSVTSIQIYAFYEIVDILKRSSFQAGLDDVVNGPVAHAFDASHPKTDIPV